MRLLYAVRPRPSAVPAADVVVAFWKRDALPFSGSEKRRVQQFLERVAATDEVNEVQVMPFPQRNATRSLLLVGLGERATLDTLRRAAARAVQHGKQIAAERIAIVVPEEFQDGEAVGIASVEGAELGGYVFARYRADLAKKERINPLRNVDLFVSRALVPSVRRGLGMGKVFALATARGRDLVNEPGCRATPQALVEEARRIARASRGKITVEVLDRTACEERGMGAFLAVAQGSTHPPAFIHLAYNPGGGNSVRGKGALPTVALVGKGITFDSGGLSLKPSQSMETMKTDMAGAAVVLSVFSALPDLRLPMHVHGFIAACENMPSGTAMRPGDIVQAASGKTIEILNTDAEGRLTLADALHEAQKVKPAILIDLATLTGASYVALGDDVAALFSNDPEKTQQLSAAAHRAGELVWEMPLVEAYREFLRSPIADLKNIRGKQWGGAITAALFLREFVGKTPWIHLDIAGPAFAEQQSNPVVPLGGTGFGVRTLLHFLERMAAEKTEPVA